METKRKEKRELGTSKGTKTQKKKFMHVPLKEYKKNFIKRISIESNLTFDKVDDIVEAIWGYFATLFTTTNPSSNDISQYTKTSKPRVIKEINNRLNKNCTREEVEVALKQMAPFNSLGQMDLGLISSKSTRKQSMMM